MRHLIFCLGLTVLSGPALAQHAQQAHVPEDACGAAGFQGLVGQHGAIAEMLIIDMPKRVIPHDSAVTMDFRPDRINFELDEDDMIAVIRCG